MDSQIPFGTHTQFSFLSLYENARSHEISQKRTISQTMMKSFCSKDNIHWNTMSQLGRFSSWEPLRPMSNEILLN